MTRTSIEWTDATWNPIRGCSVVSPGCVNCYAMKQAHRFSGPGGAYEGLTKLTKAGPQWTGTIRPVAEAFFEPLKWRKPRRVFVNSMSDLFHESVEFEVIERVFSVMAQARRHTFQILTKRAARMREIVPCLAARHTAPDGSGWPLPNVWLGVSVENQQLADERIPLLLQTPGAVRFISAEPLLGPVDIAPWLRAENCRHPGEFCEDIDCRGETRLDWVIVGGESGPGARPLDVRWVRNIVHQCKQRGVAVFVKQLGANVRDRNDAGFEGIEETDWPIDIDQFDRIEDNPDGFREEYQGAPVRIRLIDRKGGDINEWPADLRVREFPRGAA